MSGGRTLLAWAGATVELPDRPLNDRQDGGHLLVQPPRQVWERGELDAGELVRWSCLVAATGTAMLEALPQLHGGCINYWEAGNYALNDAAAPVGRKDPRVHRRMHLHVFGRNPDARDPRWRWGEAPRFFTFAEWQAGPRPMVPLTPAECGLVVARVSQLLADKYCAVG